METSLSTVILWTNGTVTVFDETGRQAVDLEGDFAAVAREVLRRSDAMTAFWFGHLAPPALLPSSRQAFMRIAGYGE